MAIEVELFDDLDAVARDDAGALDRGTQRSLFDRLDWYRLTLAHCPPAGRPLVIRARDGAACGWLFLMADGHRARALASWYSLSYRAIIAGAADSAQADAIALALARGVGRHRPRIGRVELGPLEEDSALPEAFRQAGWITRTHATTVNWCADVRGLNFADYWGQRPARLRNTAARKARAAALDIRIHRAFDPDAWEDYEAVYRRSWKPEEGSPAFLRALAEREGAAGTLRLGLAYRGGRPIAAQLWLIEHGVATIHKLAHVEAERQLSPGTVLSRAMFAQVIDEDRPDRIDFGTGDDSYKADWMDEKRPLFGMIAYDPRSIHGIAAFGRTATAKLVGRVRKD